MKRQLSLMALLTGAVLLSACTAYPVQEDSYYEYGQPVRVAPPPPQYEYYGSPPVVGHVWVGGYWNWVGVRYIWVPGRWEAPRPGHIWVPHHWERDGNYWRQHGGRWDRDPQPRVVPVPPPAQRPHVEHREQHRPDSAPVLRAQPERNVAPRIEREARPAPERSGGTRGDREDRRRQRADDDNRSDRRDRGGDR